MGRLLRRLGGNPAGRQGQGNPERRRHRDREGAGTQRGEAAAAVAPGPALRSYQVIETPRFSIAPLPTRVSRTRRLNRRNIAGLLRPGADRKRGGEGKGGSGRLAPRGRRSIKNTTK